jgi:hypothetical protein
MRTQMRHFPRSRHKLEAILFYFRHANCTNLGLSPGKPINMRYLADAQIIFP